MPGCSELQASVLEYISQSVRASEIDSYCVVTVPLSTIDGRSISIVVENQYGDLFSVHDAGKTSSEFYCQGVELTDKKLELNARIAQSLGVSIGRPLIQRICKKNEINESILAVAQCVALVSLELLSHKIVVEAQTVSNKLRTIFENLRSPEIHSIQRAVPVKGRITTHVFNYVVYPSAPSRRSVAVKLLGISQPSYQATKFGYMNYDLAAHSVASKWAQLAIIPRAEQWHKRDLEIVSNFSTTVIEVRSGEEDRLDSEVPEVVLDLLSIEVPDRPRM